jgi:hypothetical protein
VRRAADGGPLPGADVWLPALDVRKATDSLGVFHFEELPVGPQLVQTRRIGYLIQRDTLTLVAGRETRREYAMMAQGTMLDTMRTTADQSKSISPALRGFEDRRASGLGRFIGSADLRANDERNLSIIILSYIPGVKLVHGPSGGSYLVSTRKACANSALLGGCKPCFVTIYMDGALMFVAQDDRSSQSPPDISRIHNSELAGAEFYGGGGSAPAGIVATSSGCGTLMLWTREHQVAPTPHTIR